MEFPRSVKHPSLARSGRAIIREPSGACCTASKISRPILRPTAILVFPVSEGLMELFQRPSKATSLRSLRERGETLASFVFRDATAQDVPALAQLHVTTFNETHCGGLSRGPTYEIREWQWREMFAKADGS